MKWAERLKRRRPTRVHSISVVAAVGVFAVVSLVPGMSGAAGSTWRSLRSALHTTRTTAKTGPASRARRVTTNGQSFGGVAAVGALFLESSGKLGQHFCTASVVDSPHGDLAVTAAHCVTGVSSQVVFVPGYANGTEPYGIWQVTHVYTDQAWQSSQDPNDDVAFLQLSGTPGDTEPIEAVTGAEQLATGASDAAGQELVQVIGYPDGADQPVTCVNWTKIFSPTQLEFDCGGYTNGTSGGPFLANVSTSSGEGTVIGVIGGYEQGGDTPQVSYSAAFGTAVAGLYQTAEASS
jgi:Trypsin-like peptidase domain